MCVLASLVSSCIIKNREVIETEELFTFEIDLGSGSRCLLGQRLEDVLYNCLDFCKLYRKQAHFLLRGENAARHPELSHALDILREEVATFSLLSGPEQSLYEQRRETSDSPRNRIKVLPGGEASCEYGQLGNMLQDRLGDLWEVSKIQKGCGA